MRSKSRDLRGVITPRSNYGGSSARAHINDENSYNIASVPHSPKNKANTPKRKTILRSLDINCDLKTFASDKPSQFKKNHQSETPICSARSKNDHKNESFHYIESRDTVDLHQGPTSMEVLLPAAKNRHLKESCDLEIQNQPDSQNTIEEEVQEDEQEQPVQLDTENELQSQNDNHQAIEIESNPQIITATTTTTAINPIVFGSHIEAAYKQIFVLYAIWFLSYAILLGLNFGLYPYYVAFIFAWGIEGYFFYKNCKAMRTLQDDPSASRRKLVYNFFILSFALIQVLAVLKFEGVSLTITLGVIPMAVATLFTCYLNSSSHIRKSNSIITFIQILITLQLACIGLKLDGYLFWSWTGVLWLGWASLVIIAFYGFGLLMVFSFYLIFEESSIAKSYQLAGLGAILIGCYGYVATGFFFMAGFTSKLDDGNDYNYIQFALLGGMVHVVLLSAFTFCAKNKIKRFLQRIVRAPSEENEETASPLVRFEKATEGLPAYIVRFTPSYFLTFDATLKLKDEKKLRKMKKKVSLTKTCQYKPNILTRKSKFGKEKGDTIPLSERRVEFSTDKQNYIGMTVTPRPGLSAKNCTKPQYFASEARKKISKDDVNLDIQENDNDKICFSANDIEFVRKIETFGYLSEAPTPTYVPKEAQNEKDDGSCIICFDKFADAVIMGCGHGGICYECALQNWKKSQECFLCRAKIEKVLRIEANKVGKFNMMKVLSARRMVKEEAPVHNVQHEVQREVQHEVQQEVHHEMHYEARNNYRSSLYMAMNYL